MNDSKISVRYAKAFYSLCEDQKILEAAKNDMTLFLEICQMPEIKWLLNSPVFTVTDKVNAIKAVLSNQVNAATLKLILFVIENKRDSYLPIIARNYIGLYNKNKGILQSKLITAGEVDATVIEKLKTFIREKMKTEVSLEHEIKPEILGGFVLRIEDTQIDAGVKSKLNQIRRALTTGEYENKI